MRLAGKAYGSGQKLLILGSAERLAEIDKALWVQQPESFLPHAIAGGADDALQPILLSTIAEPANGAALLMIVEIGMIGDFHGFSRILNLFEEGTDGHKRARADWKALSGRDGAELSYWQQKDGGGWSKAA